MPINTKEIAKEKAQKALRLIEQAQTLLGEACAELSSLSHGAKQWKAVGDHYDKTKELWHKINMSLPLEKIDLDPDTARSYFAKLRQKNGL